MEDIGSLYDSCAQQFYDLNDKDISIDPSFDESVVCDFGNFVNSIKDLRLRNVNRVLIGNININSIPNKFSQLKELVLKYVDILVITETKLDDSFPNAQFLVDGFSVPFRFDRNRNGGHDLCW